MLHRRFNLYARKEDYLGNAIINTMEVLETKPLSELVTEATIKVCYVSPDPNRNNTVITTEVGDRKSVV